MSQEALPGFTRARRAREGGLALMLLLPSLVIFGVFVFYPLVHNVYLGFFRSPPFPGLPSTYVGLDQYKDVLTSSDFLDSLKTTVLFALYIVLGHRVAQSPRVRGIDGLALAMLVAAVVALPIGIADAAPAFGDPVAMKATMRELRNSADPVIALYAELERVLPRPFESTVSLL